MQFLIFISILVGSTIVVLLLSRLLAKVGSRQIQNRSPRAARGQHSADPFWGYPVGSDTGSDSASYQDSPSHGSCDGGGGGGYDGGGGGGYDGGGGCDGGGGGY